MLRLLGIAVVVLALGVYSSAFIVDEREKAIMLKFGEAVRSDFEPGLHFKIPVVNNVRKFDKRVLTVDQRAERFFTVEKKDLLVDSFIKWRIDDVVEYFKATGGDERVAAQRLLNIVNDGLRSEFGKRTIQEVVAGERQEVMEILRSQANERTRRLGIAVVDVRIKRIDLPVEVSTSVYRRMRAERERVARDFRSRGAEAAERIRADADRQNTVVLAEAYRDSEKTRGEGDARAAEIYATAFGQDPEFFRFYRSLAAYRSTFSSKSDLMVVDPESEFFRYLNDPMGGAGSN